MIKPREYSLVAKSYATALFNAASKAGQLGRLREEALALASMRGSERVTQFLTNPQVPTEDKLEYLDRALGGRCLAPLVRTIKLMVQRERTSELHEVLLLLLELIDEAEGIHPAIVESAVALDAGQRQQLQASLERHTGKRLRIEFYVDPRLLGGLVFRFRDVLIDSSIAHGLEQLKRRMLGTQVA